jgi:signal transduction histidine kinase
MSTILGRRGKATDNTFTSLVAHQLRTLPNIISWDIESLLARRNSLSKKDQAVLRRVADANKRMVTLIDTMLNISRIELRTVAITPHKINLADCINEELSLLSEAYHHTLPRITTAYPTKPCELTTDEDFVRLIAQNILSNAIKYTPKEGSVHVVIRDTAHAYRIEVSDTGLGIPSKEQRHVFGKLFRAENVLSSSIPGNGLGLHLTRELVRLLRGRIWFTSTETHGTHFFVELPHKALPKRAGTTLLTYKHSSQPGGGEQL